VTVLVCYNTQAHTLNRWVKEPHQKLVRTHTLDFEVPDPYPENAIPMADVLRFFRASPPDEDRVGVLAYSAARLLT
jgi:hypothetical protein